MSDLPENDLPETDQPETATAAPATDDHGDALERSAESIREARDAEGTVAANDDITARDDERAGEYSEDPGGEGGHP
jgi:hypothetical protein